MVSSTKNFFLEELYFIGPQTSAENNKSTYYIKHFVLRPSASLKVHYKLVLSNHSTSFLAHRLFIHKFFVATKIATSEETYMILAAATLGD